MADQYKELDYKAAEIDSILLDVYNSKGENASLTVRLSAIDTAISSKVDKVSGKGLSTNDFTDADKQKLDSLHNYDDTALSGRVYDLEASQVQQDTEIAAVQAEADAVANAGAKNYVKYNMTVPSELSAVVNSDGSITVTASTTSIRRLTIATDLTRLISGNMYILSGCTGGNPSTTYHLGITKINYAGVVYQTNAEVQFTKSDEMALVVLTVQAGQNWTKTFYPMIRRKEIVDSTFQPYAPTNRELYEMILQLQNNA